jgi:hypothetical protein
MEEEKPYVRGELHNVELDAMSGLRVCEGSNCEASVADEGNEELKIMDEDVSDDE